MLRDRPERNTFPNQKANGHGPLHRMPHSKSILDYNDVKAIYVQQILLQGLDSDIYPD